MRTCCAPGWSPAPAIRSDPRSASDARLAIWPELRGAYTEPTDLAEATPLDAAAQPDALLAQALAVIRQRRS